MGYFGFPTGSSTLTGVLRFMAPAWLVWILAVLLLHFLLGYKRYFPAIITGIMEYGKLRSKPGGLLQLSLPKRWSTTYCSDSQ